MLKALPQNWNGEASWRKKKTSQRRQGRRNCGKRFYGFETEDTILNDTCLEQSLVPHMVLWTLYTCTERRQPWAQSGVTQNNINKNKLEVYGSESRWRIWALIPQIKLINFFYHILTESRASHITTSVSKPQSQSLLVETLRLVLILPSN